MIVKGVQMAMGMAAAEKCDDFGWHPRGHIDPSLVAEIAHHPRFGLGHAWSRSAGYALTTAPTRTYVVLTMEGGFEIDVDGTTVTTEAGSLIFLNGDAPTTARSLTETARFVWHLEPTFLHPRRAKFQYGEPISTGGASVEALTTMTNALVKAPVPTGETARRHFALSFENLFAAVLEQGTGRHPNMAHHRDGLFMAAVVAIEAHFRDPAFTGCRLAKEMSVSLRTLQEAFSRMGTTPRREIERRRVTEADRVSAIETMSAASLAERVGFTSARQLNRARSRSIAGSPQE
jgi:AraC-like DNA-binding protein